MFNISPGQRDVALGFWIEGKSLGPELELFRGLGDRELPPELFLSTFLLVHSLPK